MIDRLATLDTSIEPAPKSPALVFLAALPLTLSQPSFSSLETLPLEIPNNFQRQTNADTCMATDSTSRVDPSTRMLTACDHRVRGTGNNIPKFTAHLISPPAQKVS